MRVMPWAEAAPPTAAQSSPVTVKEPSGQRSTTSAALSQGDDQVVLLYGPSPDARGRAAVDELVGAGIGDDAAPGDDEQVVGGQGHLAHEMAGEEHRAALDASDFMRLRIQTIPSGRGH